MSTSASHGHRGTGARARRGEGTITGITTLQGAITTHDHGDPQHHGHSHDHRHAPFAPGADRGVRRSPRRSWWSRRRSGGGRRASPCWPTPATCSPTPRRSASPSCAQRIAAQARTRADVRIPPRGGARGLRQRHRAGADGDRGSSSRRPSAGRSPRRCTHEALAITAALRPHREHGRGAAALDRRARAQRSTRAPRCAHVVSDALGLDRRHRGGRAHPLLRLDAGRPGDRRGHRRRSCSWGGCGSCATRPAC